ncbi:MAG: ABC transporter ATP-binding protein, partial [Bacteroidales bacterium]
FIFEGEGKVKDFPGNYTRYRLQKKAKEKRAQANKPRAAQRKRDPGKRDPNKATYKQKQRYIFLEKEIERLEEEKEHLTHKLNSGELKPDELQKVSEDIGRLMEKIDEYTMEWIRLDELEM